MLQTNRLIVRKFSPADGDALFAYLSLPETYVFEPGSPVTREEACKMAEERAMGDNFFAVELRDTGRMIGHLYFQKIQPDHFMTWELGYIFNPAFQRQGYCTEASRALFAHAFTGLGAHRIVANCSEQNPASWRVLEKLGMRREGHFIKKAHFRKDGNGKPLWFNSYQYAILEEEFSV